MLRLASLLYSVIGTTLAGTFIIAALVAGLDTARPIVAAAALGFGLAIPATWLVARSIMQRIAAPQKA